MNKLKMHSPNLTDGNIDRIRELFPGCVTEAHDEHGTLKLSVDFDQLKQELSDSIVEGPQERYHLNWPGKREALLTANAPIAKTLRPCREESVDFDTTKNLFIEGDNLDALKLLQETYLGKVKMIYIDPPYNTGNDFIYEDDFAENADEFLLRSNQKDEEGNRLVANTESNGRFHSDWLSMIYPRLKLARNLLKDDGVIFVSVDDGEQANMKRLCDEIFGERNFIADLIWSNKEGGGSSDSNYFRIKHEHILCYAKELESVEINGVPISNLERYTQKDEFFSDRGPYYLQKLGMGTIQYSKSLDYEIETPDKSIITPKDNNRGKKACWRWSKTKFEWGLNNGFVVFQKDRLGIWTVYTKQYLKCDNEGKHINRTQRPFGVIDIYSSTQASKYLDSIGLGSFFNYSKPYELISFLINRVINKEGLILDFFAGSSTTAHAVMQLNAEDGGNRKFIMVQLPELCNEQSEAFKAGYKTIAEISKERIRRAGKKIKDEKQETATGQGVLQYAPTAIDTGFRVLKIDSSNMAEVYYTPDAVKQEDLFNAIDNIKPDRTPEDLLFQILLDLSVDLSLPTRKELIQGKTVFFVNQPPYDLIACFDTGVSEELVKELAQHKPLRVVFRDTGFTTDTVKINVDQIFRQLAPGTEVKSI
jgi:adenine-specific DNA-methyltransferase